jgi:hypothetical protein
MGDSQCFTKAKLLENGFLGMRMCSGTALFPLSFNYSRTFRTRLFQEIRLDLLSKLDCKECSMVRNFGPPGTDGADNLNSGPGSLGRQE